MLDAEHRIIAARFRGSRSAYRAALGDAKVSLAVARGIIGDELRRAVILAEASLPDFPRPTRDDVTRFRSTFASVLARQVVVDPAPSWLPEGTGSRSRRLRHPPSSASPHAAR